MPSPLPGVGIPALHTFLANSPLFAGGFRWQPADLAALYFNRPSYLTIMEGGAQTWPANTWTDIACQFVVMDNWGGTAGSVFPGAAYAVQLPGYYLYEAGLSNEAGQAATVSVGCAVDIASTFYEVARQSPSGGAEGFVLSGGLLVQETTTGVTRAAAAGPTAAGAPFTSTPYGNRFQATWVGVPAASGVVVTSPQIASLFPPGSGTSLNSGISAGATSITVPNTIGMVVGGTLLLDYGTGFYEPVAITSVNYATGVVGISATVWPHGGAFTAGHVLVPVTAAFMNQQVRDTVNFLAYPPMLQAHVNSVATTIAAQVFPAGTLLAMDTADTDNFGGFNATTHLYTFPVSGIYQIFGLAELGWGNANSKNFMAHVGYAINGGTIQWCGMAGVIQNTNAQPVGPSFSAHVRVNKGDTIGIYAQHSAAAALPIGDSSPTITSRMIAIWRGF